MLKFFRGNAKLNKLESIVGGPVYTFSELSGHTCPFAQDCLSKAIDVAGKRHVEDGKHTKYRCFSASQEALYPAVYNTRKHNTDLIKSIQNEQDIAALILDSLPQDAKCIRVHVGGDFSLQRHFDAWIRVAKYQTDILFYAYTKALPFWIKRRNNIPDNFVLTASRGGKRDDLIDSHNLREAVVIAEPTICEYIVNNKCDKIPYGDYAGYEIDHDDSHAALPSLKNKSFALLVHGGQPAGSDAGKAVRKLNGNGSYGRKS